MQSSEAAAALPSASAPRAGFYLSSALLVLACAVLFLVDRARNLGLFNYIIDDPYIHLAMAKNLVKHGVWGVSPYGFASASSSPLWILVIAPGLLAGADSSFALLFPLLVNLVCAIGVLHVADRWLESEQLPRGVRWVLAPVLLVLTPMVVLVFVGMEHMLHLLIFLLFLRDAAKFIDDPNAGSRALIRLAALGAVLMLIRLEGMFAVGAVGLFLALRKRFGQMFVLGSAFVPLAAFLAWSVAQGGAGLPNSVLAKGKMPSLGNPSALLTFLMSSIYDEFIDALDLGLLLLLVVACLVLSKPRTRSPHAQTAAHVWIVTCILHLQFAQVGWFFRYEAYLVATAFVLIALLAGAPLADAARDLRESFRNRSLRLEAVLVCALAVFGLGQPFLRKAATIPRKIPSLSADAFRGNWQVGRFLRAHYMGRRVALNDIGAPTFLADLHLVDLWGLGSLDVTRAARSGAFNATWVENYVRSQNSDIGVFTGVFIDGVLGGAPPSWKLVQRWAYASTDGFNELRFYALKPEHEAELSQKLAAFEPELPPGVDAIDVH